MKKRFLFYIMLLLILSCAGCGSLSAHDVIEKFQKTDMSNYHLDMKYDMEIKAGSEGISMSIPMKISLSADVTDAGAHGDMSMQASMFGMNMDMSSELYAERLGSTIRTYTFDSDSATWSVSESDPLDNLIFIGDIFKISESDVSTTTKTASGYVLTIPASAVPTNPLLAGADALSSGSLDSLDIDMFDGAEFTYTFDKDFHLVEVMLRDVSASGEEDGATYDIKLDMGMRFSQFDEIRDSDVKVPASVIALAQDAADDTYGGNNPEDDWFSYEPGDDVEEDPYAIEKPMLPVGEVPIGVVPGYYGTYKGDSIDPFGTDFFTTFGADGWTLEEDEWAESFVWATNPKYPDVTLYIYGYDAWNTSIYDIVNYGMYGYSIEWYGTGDYPDISWNGVTFGSSGEDIQNTYGLYNSSYNGEYATSYTYDSDDTGIEFTFDREEGLYRVYVRTFNW